MAKVKKHTGYRTLNYNRFTCNGCGVETVIEPGQVFDGNLNCDCGLEPTTDGLDTEISTPVQQELDYVKTQTVIVIGMFKNGDYEVCNGNNLDDTWRVPKDTFEGTYKLATTDEVKTDENPTETATNGKEDSVSKGSDPKTFTITIGDLKGLSVDEIKAEYNMDELRVLAKVLKIRGAANMGEDKLVGKLLTKVD